MINVSDKSCRENQNTHFIFYNFFFDIRAIYEIMWKNMAEPDRPQMTLNSRKRFTCWITKATITHSEYVKFIALPRQHWLQERASMLRYT